MPLQLVRKPPIGNTRNDRLNITLDGRHTMKEKACMLMQVKSWLLHEQASTLSSQRFLYFLLDPTLSLTTLRDGRAVADYVLVIQNPYRSAPTNMIGARPRPAPPPSDG